MASCDSQLNSSHLRSEVSRSREPRDRLGKPMRTPVRIALLATLLAASIPRLPATDDPGLNRTVAVNVKTEDNQLVKGLTASNFQAKMRGNSIDIESAKYEDGPRRVLILFDTSGSMGESEGHWRWGIEMANNLVFLAPPLTNFALMSFSSSINDKIDFGVSPSEFREALTKLVAEYPKGIGGKTAIFDASSQGLTSLGQGAAGDVVMVITDGGDNAIKVNQKEVVDALIKSRVRLFAFFIASTLEQRGRAPEEAAGPAELFDMTKDTGGDFASFISGQKPPAPLKPTPTDLKLIASLAHLMGLEMSEFYALGLKLSEPLVKPRDWNLEVLNALGNKHPRLRILYPHKLAACP